MKIFSEEDDKATGPLPDVIIHLSNKEAIQLYDFIERGVNPKSKQPVKKNSAAYNLVKKINEMMPIW